MKGPERKISVRFSGRTAEQNKVPALVLNQVLSGLQRSIHLLAMEHEEIVVRQRARITSVLEDKYVLLCEPFQSGSLVVTAELGDRTSDLFEEEDIGVVAKKLEQFAEALQSSNESAMQKVVRDRSRRDRLTDAVSRVIPKPGTDIHVDVGWNGTEFLSSERLRPALRQLAHGAQAQEEYRTVTGRLVSIDFDERKVTINYPPTGRQLDCFYDESTEEMLLERPRELIQVTGVIRLDEDGIPRKIVDVEEIRELDLARFYRESIVLPDGKELRFEPPLILEPRLVEDDQLIVLIEESLGIDMVGATIDDLAEDLPEEIALLWHNYALEDDGNLSPKAVELKQRLCERVSEGVPHG